MQRDGRWLSVCHSIALIVFDAWGRTDLTALTMLWFLPEQRAYICTWPDYTPLTSKLPNFLPKIYNSTLSVFFFRFISALPQTENSIFIFCLVQSTINYLERPFKLHNIPDRWARHAAGRNLQQAFLFPHRNLLLISCAGEMNTGPRNAFEMCLNLTIGENFSNKPFHLLCNHLLIHVKIITPFSFPSTDALCFPHIYA